MPTQILVVDDAQAIRECMAKILNKIGYEVAKAADGLDALAQFAVVRPDLLVTDLEMPRMYGLELCRRLRTISSVPIILATGRQIEAVSVIAFVSGANACLSKPFNLGVFMAPVKRMLNRGTEAGNC